MEIGWTLKPHQFDDDHLALAKQFGCDAIIAWVPDLPGEDGVWHTEDLKAMRKRVERHGLRLGAIENLHPAHWDKVLLGEPGRDKQIENLKQTIRNMAEAGIDTLGYYFSIVGVQGHHSNYSKPNGRGGALVRDFDADQISFDGPPDNQEVWYYGKLTHRPAGTPIGPISDEQMWERITYFLENLIPVAESCGVKLAAHPDDPPVPQLRGIARPLRTPEAYERILDLVPSPSNTLEFCQGTVSEMAGVDIYQTIESVASRGGIGYAHFRNVSGTVPRYHETFIDEGYVDMIRAIKTYKKNGFDGMISPDHTPLIRPSASQPLDTTQPSSAASTGDLRSDASFEMGMAYAIGYIRACIQAAEAE